MLPWAPKVKRPEVDILPPSPYKIRIQTEYTLSQKIAARHILVGHEYEATDILRLIEQGKGFEEMAQKFSKCPSAKAGGDLGEFGRGRMVPDFEEAAFQLKVDEVSKPTKTRFGYHLIQRYR